MKKALMIFALMMGMLSCNSGNTSAITEADSKDRVEVLYFHGKQRCATCKAIETNTQEVIDGLFADELKDGSLVFRVVDMSTSEGEKIADSYEVAWSSLFVNKWKDGKETRTDMTEFSFGYARNNPDLFKNTLADKIRQYLD